MGNLGFNQAFGFSQSCGFGNGFSYENASITTQGLVLQYETTNENSYPGAGNTITDLTGNSNATLYNSPTFSSGFITFNGTNQHLITNTSLNTKVTTDIISISMWANPLDNGVLLSERGSASLAAGWHESQMEMVAGTMRFGMWNGAGISYITSTIPTPFSSWYLFTIVYDGTKLIAYVNEQEAGTIPFSRQNPIEGGAEIHYSIAAADSTNMGNGSYSNMKLGAFYVYNTALSQQDITKNFIATRSKYGI